MPYDGKDAPSASFGIKGWCASAVAVAASLPEPPQIEENNNQILSPGISAIHCEPLRVRIPVNRRRHSFKAKHIWKILIPILAICLTAVFVSTRAETRQRELTQAAHDGDLFAVKRLVVAGARLGGPPGDNVFSGQPAFSAAASEGRNDILRFFLDHGADINTTDSADNTALNLAVIKGHLATVQLLLSRGANPNIRGGRSPLQNAEARNDEQMADLLKAEGATEETPR